MITGDDTQTQKAIDVGIIPELKKLLYSPKATVRKEAAWALSNITAGTSIQIQEVLNDGIMEKLTELSVQDIFDIRRECVWAISNATSGSSDDQILTLINLKAPEALCSLLSTNEARTLAISLEGIENLLKKAKKFLSPVI